MKHLSLSLALVVLPVCAVMAVYQLWLSHCCVLALAGG